MLSLTEQTRIWIAPALTLILTLPAYGGVLFDRSFFDGQPNTLIDFETLPDGSTLSDHTIESGLSLNANAYFDLGIQTISTTIWGRVNDLNSRPDVQFAHAQEGSGEMILWTAGIEFIESTRAFMLFGAATTWGSDASLNIFFDNGTSIWVSVENHMLGIDDPNIAADTFRFGVVGYDSGSAIGITKVQFSSGFTFIDDVQFATIPTPGTLVLGLPIALTAIRRRGNEDLLPLTPPPSFPRSPRHSRAPSVIPAPPPSFPRRRESTSHPRHQLRRVVRRFLRNPYIVRVALPAPSPAALWERVAITMQS